MTLGQASFYLPHELPLQMQPFVLPINGVAISDRRVLHAQNHWMWFRGVTVWQHGFGRFRQRQRRVVIADVSPVKKNVALAVRPERADKFDPGFVAGLHVPQ